ncbi:MAG TPA: chemotaxis protein CheB, partial [Thermoanaerobaculia bacterium]
MRARKGKKRVSDETTSSDTQVAASADLSDNGALVIAGIGASAGGIQALTQFFRALPSDSGVGFVVIQHLAPERESILAQILARDTSMPVIEVKDAPRVEPNHVYVIPPNRGMTIAAGHLRLLPRSQSRLAHRPIDSFFRSLATERHDHAIAVILSGTGSDGTLGLQEVKAEGGVTFAQDITAEHDGMPKSAIATGSVDFILPPEGMA